MTTTTTTSELPDARHWLGRDWLKLLVASGLALSLIRFGPATPAVVDPPDAPSVVPPTVPVVQSGLAAPTLDAPGPQLRAGPVQLSGTGAPGTMVRVMLNGFEAGQATVDSDGRWAITAILPGGEVAVVAEARNGDRIAASKPLLLTITGPPPVAPPATAAAPATTAAAPASVGTGELALSFPQEGAQLPAGPFELSGSGVPGTTIEVLSSDQVVATAPVGDAGTWRAQADLGQGTAALSVREQGSDQIAGRPIRVTVGQAEQISCTTLTLGCKAFVTRQGGLVLRMRDAPTTAGAIIARLPIGSELELLAGPAPANGFSWWRVRTLAGNAGWVAGEHLVLRPD